jgi:hypothetical protein
MIYELDEARKNNVHGRIYIETSHPSRAKNIGDNAMMSG